MRQSHDISISIFTIFFMTFVLIFSLSMGDIVTHAYKLFMIRMYIFSMIAIAINIIGSMFHSNYVVRNFTKYINTILIIVFISGAVVEILRVSGQLK